MTMNWYKSVFSPEDDQSMLIETPTCNHQFLIHELLLKEN